MGGLEDVEAAAAAEIDDGFALAVLASIFLRWGRLLAMHCRYYLGKRERAERGRAIDRDMVTGEA